jgi:hypothetical protein
MSSTLSANNIQIMVRRFFHSQIFVYLEIVFFFNEKKKEDWSSNTNDLIEKSGTRKKKK